LTVGHRARFAVPDSVAQVEVCCVSQWGLGRGLLCLSVGRAARFAVSRTGALARFVVSDSGAQGKVCCA